MRGLTRLSAMVFAALVSGCMAGQTALDASAKNYIVQLTAAPLVSYAGGVEGLAPTSPQVSGASGVDLNTSPSQAYLGYLKKLQAKLIATMTDVLARPVTPIFSYYYAFDGFTVRLTPAEAARVTSIPGVSSVHPDRAYPALEPDRSLPAKPPGD